MVSNPAFIPSEVLASMSQMFVNLDPVVNSNVCDQELVLLPAIA